MCLSHLSNKIIVVLHTNIFLQLIIIAVGTSSLVIRHYRQLRSVNKTDEMTMLELLKLHAMHGTFKFIWSESEEIKGKKRVPLVYFFNWPRKFQMADKQNFLLLPMLLGVGKKKIYMYILQLTLLRGNHEFFTTNYQSKQNSAKRASC